jgi:predicted house-cleaning NTP pyrophosphatase (Maf/HAM1 superfamily)
VRLRRTVVAQIKALGRSSIKKYLVATVLITSFAASAFAEEIYVAFDPASHKCIMMHSQPAAPMKSMGSFKSEAEAKAAMAKM